MLSSLGILVRALPHKRHRVLIHNTQPARRGGLQAVVYPAKHRALHPHQHQGEGGGGQDRDAWERVYRRGYPQVEALHE